MPLCRYCTTEFGGLGLFKICQVLLGLKSYPIQLSTKGVERTQRGDVQDQDAPDPDLPFKGAFGRHRGYPPLRELGCPLLRLEPGQVEFG
jgi:hypothetical protein